MKNWGLTRLVVGAAIVIFGILGLSTLQARADDYPLPEIGFSVAPPSTWTNQSIIEYFTCSTPGCNMGSFKYKKYFTYKDSCLGDNQSTYTSGHPETIDEHVWLCGYACNFSGQCTFTNTATEFFVDRIAPPIQHPTSTETGGLWAKPDIHFTLGNSWDFAAYENGIFYPGSGIGGFRGYCNSTVIELDSSATGFDCHFPDGKGNSVGNSARDLAGNWTTNPTTVSPIWVDGSAPTIVIDNPEIATGRDFIVVAHAEDNLSGVATRQWLVISGPDPGSVVFGQPTNDSSSVHISGPEGTYVLRYSVTDNIGNTGTKDITVLVDITPPIITLNSPSSGSLLKSPLVNASFTVSDSFTGVSTCSLLDNNELKATFSVNQTLPQDLIKTYIGLEGGHTWKVSCTDVAGNVQNVEQPFTITAKPKWQYTELVNNGSFEAGANSWIGSTDRIGYFPAYAPWHSGLQGVFMQYGSFAVNQTVTIPSDSQGSHLTAWYKGNYESYWGHIKVFSFDDPSDVWYLSELTYASDWTKVVVDIFGHQGMKAVVQLQFGSTYEGSISYDDVSLTSISEDTNAPLTTLSLVPSTPIGADGYYSETPNISLSASDNIGGSGIREIKYRWDANTFSVYNGSFMGLEGIHTLYYYAVDNAGNVEVEKQIVVKVNTTPPPPTATAEPTPMVSAPIIFVPAPTTPSGKVLGVEVFKPIVSNQKTVSGALVIKVGTKKVTLRPFGTAYKGAIWAKKVNFGLDGVVYLFAPLGKYTKGSIKVYNQNGKLLGEYKPFGGFAKNGFNLDIAVSKDNIVFLPVATPIAGTTVRIYKVTTKGLVTVNSIKATKKTGNLIVRLSKIYSGDYGLLTYLKGQKSTLKVWKYNATTKKFVEDTKYNKAKIKI